MTARHALWLVQVRNAGEAWRTLSRHLARSEAQAVAECEAAQHRLYGVGSDVAMCPVWSYIRLAYRRSHVDVANLRSRP